MRFAPVDLGLGEQLDVTVAAVFAQRRGRLPYVRERVSRGLDVAVGGEEGSVLAVPVLDRFRQEWVQLRTRGVGVRREPTERIGCGV